MAKRIKRGKDDSPLKSITYNFENNLYNLEFFTTSLLPSAVSSDDRAKEGMGDLRRRMGELVESYSVSSKDRLREADGLVNAERISTAVNGIVEIFKEYDWALVNITLSDQRCELLWKASFMMMIAYFDYLLSDILHCYYDRYPEALNEEMTLSYGELRKCSNLKEANNILIERKIESLLYKRFDERLRFFADVLVVDIAETKIRWEIINEAYQRRNIIVHNNGIVNGRYIRNVVHCNGGEKLKAGDRLTISAEYYLRACREVLFGGIILVQNCWRKWFKNDVKAANFALVSSIHKGLMIGAYEITWRLVAFTKEIKEYYKDNKDVIDILYCFALKKAGLNSEFETEKNKLDRVRLSLSNLAALAVIEDDKEGFYEYVGRAAKTGEIKHFEFNANAIYREFMRDADFEAKWNEAFK